MGRVYVTLGTIKYNFLKKDGFTLLELLLALIIFIVLSTIAVTTLDKGDSALGLERVENEIEQAIEIAKFNAFNGKKHQDKHSPGFGVYFTTDNGTNNIITVFADCNASKGYDGGLLAGQPDYLCTEEFIEEFVLFGDFYVSGLCTVGDSNHADSCGSNQSSLSVIFWSPYAILGHPELDPSSELTNKYVKIRISSLSNEDLNGSYILVNQHGRSTVHLRPALQ